MERPSDVNTTGMLLVTTDGQWCQRVAHPKSEVVKSYVLTASARPTKAQLKAMASGAEVDGAFVKPVNVRSMDNDRDGGPPNRVLVEVVDGRNREVRELASSAGVDAKKLKRVRVGGLRMPSELPLGKYMALKPHQVGYVLDKGLMYNEKAAESSGGKMGRSPV
jgi:pseudouridine synthase